MNLTVTNPTTRKEANSTAYRLAGAAGYDPSLTAVWAEIRTGLNAGLTPQEAVAALAGAPRAERKASKAPAGSLRAKIAAHVPAERTHLWGGQPVTAAQFAQRERMAKAVPPNSGPIARVAVQVPAEAPAKDVTRCGAPTKAGTPCRSMAGRCLHRLPAPVTADPATDKAAAVAALLGVTRAQAQAVMAMLSAV